jgi:hypothetical protein
MTTCVFLQEKEAEMAAISAQRTKFADAELERLQESEHTSRAEIANLKKQLQQLATDFKYNLQLIKDRDTELEVLENQIKAHKTTEARVSEVRFKFVSLVHTCMFGFQSTFCSRFTRAYHFVTRHCALCLAP